MFRIVTATLVLVLLESLSPAFADGSDCEPSVVAAHADSTTEEQVQVADESPQPKEQKEDAARDLYEYRADLPYVRRGSETLLANTYVPRKEGPFPGILMVHGGGWTSGERWQMDGLSRQLASQNYVVVSITYRKAPVHKFPAQLEDCQDALRWMRRESEQLKIDPQRIGGFGYSAGAHLVSLLGTRNEAAPNEKTISLALQAVVAGGTPTDFRWIPAKLGVLSYFLGGTREQFPDRYRDGSPVHFVSKDDPPFFFYHGTSDLLVPVFGARNMHAELLRAGVQSELLEIKRAGHMGAFLDKRGPAEAVEFLDRHLK